MMTSEEHLRMNELCILIQEEKDPEKCTELVQELNDLLDQANTADSISA
jgi:hypothetical protein